MDRRDFFTLRSPRPRDVNRAHTLDGVATQTAPTHARRTDTGLEPLHSAGNAWGYPQAAHLLRRCMTGPTDAEIRQAVADGMDATVAKLLTPFEPSLTLIEDWENRDPQVRVLSSDPNVAMALQKEIVRRRETLVRWWHHTIATSPVSIQERMVLFWHNHFVSDLGDVLFPQWMLEQNRLFRRSMLGNFKQLVKDVTKDVAMLYYLDGVQNFKSGDQNNINENYARELQELFTMGVTDWDEKPNYTEGDVAEASRALSGWVIADSQQVPTFIYAGRVSRFEPLRWDSGEKTFLGKTGAWGADDIVDIIFSERADQVARFMCEKLYRTFVYDIPDRVVIAQMADTFRNSNWEIRPVMEQLLKSAHFYDEANIGGLYKSQVEYMVGLIRGMGVSNVSDFNSASTGRFTNELGNRIAALGMVLFYPPNVKGWPGGRTWVSTSTLPPRQKFAMDVVRGAIKGEGDTQLYAFDPIAFARTFPKPDDIHELSADMAQFLLNTPPSQKESDMLYSTLLDSGVDYEWDLDDPEQKPAERISKFLAAAVQLAKFQLY